MPTEPGSRHDDGRPPVRVGIVGAGPWATMLHGPLFGAGPDTVLAGVYARRPEAATALAANHGAPSFERYEDLLARSDVIAVAVAPDAQPTYALAAAAAGVPLLLDKPLALDLAGAEALAHGLGTHPALVLLTLRYSQAARDLVAGAAAIGADRAVATWTSGALLAGPFSASPWRQAHGGLLDTGPHCFDLLAATLGPVVAVEAAGEAAGRVEVAMVHAGGATSSATIDARSADGDRSSVVASGSGGEVRFDAAGAFGRATFAALVAAVVGLGRGEPVADASLPTVADALAAQRVVDAALRAIGR